MFSYRILLSILTILSLIIIKPRGEVLAAVIGEQIIVQICGNSVLESPEQCDDGNIVDGDECSATCFTEGRPPDAQNPDTDEDGVSDSGDNCPTVSNPDQTNEDNDSLGDACDDCNDANGDGVCNNEADPNDMECTCSPDNPSCSHIIINHTKIANTSPPTCIDECKSIANAQCDAELNQ